MTRRNFCKLSGGTALVLVLPPLPAPALAYNFITPPDTGVYLSDAGPSLVIEGLHALRGSLEHLALTAEQSAEMCRLFSVPRHLIRHQQPNRSNAEVRDLSTT